MASLTIRNVSDDLVYQIKHAALKRKMSLSKLLEATFGTSVPTTSISAVSSAAPKLPIAPQSASPTSEAWQPVDEDEPFPTAEPQYDPSPEFQQTILRKAGPLQAKLKRLQSLSK